MITTAVVGRLIILAALLVSTAGAVVGFASGSIASLENGRAGLLLIVTPLVSWIWVAVLLMAAGGVIALVPGPKFAPKLVREQVQSYLAKGVTP